jgi:hypothetical protein
MSGKSYDDYTESLSRRARTFSTDSAERERAHSDSIAYVTRAKSEVHTKSVSARETRKVSAEYDAGLVRNKITSPAAGVERVHVVLVDNSGSNHEIANHLMQASAYLMSTLNTLDAKSQIAWMYCSDHGDGDSFEQEIDFMSPDKKGDKALLSTIHDIRPANGFDAAEAWECALLDACKINFGSACKKHLYLITDVVGHGMGMRGDDGCPFQRDWRETVDMVYKTYDTFQVIGSGCNADVGKLQAKFLKPERVPFDLVDLSAVTEFSLRAGLTGNALLFLIARNTGMQGVELFLSFLYEKWIDDPIFGDKTEGKAKEMIHRFGKYVEASEGDVKALLEKVFV